MRKNSVAFTIVACMKMNSFLRQRQKLGVADPITTFSRPMKNEVSIRLNFNLIKRS